MAKEYAGEKNTEADATGREGGERGRCENNVESQRREEERGEKVVVLAVPLRV